MSSLVAPDRVDLRAQRWLRWLTRSTGLSACGLSVLLVLVVKVPCWLAGVKGHDLQYFSGILGLAVAYVALPRGTEVVGRPSRWALVAGRAPAESRKARVLAFLAVGLSAAFVVFAAVCAVAGETRVLSLAYGLGQQVAFMWWLIAVLGRWGGTWSERSGEATPKVRDFDIAGWASAHSLALHSRSGWGFLTVCLVHWLLVGFAVGGPELSDDNNESYWTISVFSVGAAYAAFWLIRGGWVTIDPDRREVAWRRPPKGPIPTRTWRFDEIQAIETRGPTRTVVRIDVGTRKLVVKTADAEKAWQLVESLREAAAAAVAVADRN